MGKPLEYKVYLLGGALSAREHAVLYDKYHRLLAPMVPARAGAFPIRFLKVEFCSRARLIEVLTDPFTVGMFWHGHGRPSGSLLTNEGHEKARRTVNPYALAKDLALARRELSPNLQFLALISCHSDKFAKEWRALLPAGAVLKTFHGKVISAGGETRGHVTRWITQSGKTPSGGARNILAHAEKRLTKYQPVPGLAVRTPVGGTRRKRTLGYTQAPITSQAPWHWHTDKRGRTTLRMGPKPPVQVKPRKAAPVTPRRRLLKRKPQTRKKPHGAGLSISSGSRRVARAGDRLRGSTALRNWARKRSTLEGAKSKHKTLKFRRRWDRPRKTVKLRRVIQPGYFIRHGPGGKRRIVMVPYDDVGGSYW